MEKVKFKRMDMGSPEEYEFLHEKEVQFTKELPDRLMLALNNLKNSLPGYEITRLDHSLQTATRAENDNADIELIVASLIHDLGDDLAPANHSQLASTIIRPYVREEVTWIIKMHGVFQLYYFGPKDYDGKSIGIDKNLRDMFKDHKWYASCDKFCRDWDQLSFDPDYPTKPISYFEPMLREVFTRVPFDPKYVENQEF